MVVQVEKLPIGIKVKTTEDIGILIKAQRKLHGVKQSDVTDILDCGNRLIVDIEAGKRTTQSQKLLDVLSVLGFEIIIRSKA